MMKFHVFAVRCFKDLIWKKSKQKQAFSVWSALNIKSVAVSVRVSIVLNEIEKLSSALDI